MLLHILFQITKHLEIDRRKSWKKSKDLEKVTLAENKKFKFVLRKLQLPRKRLQN